jgi:hypothetical protein
VPLPGARNGCAGLTLELPAAYLKRLAERRISARVQKMRPTYETIYVPVIAVDQARGTVAVTVNSGEINAKL